MTEASPALKPHNSSAWGHLGVWLAVVATYAVIVTTLVKQPPPIATVIGLGSYGLLVAALVANVAPGILGAFVFTGAQTFVLVSNRQALGPSRFFALALGCAVLWPIMMRSFRNAAQSRTSEALRSLATIPARECATWFGAGYLPKGSGTLGALAALPLAHALLDLPFVLRLTITLVLTALLFVPAVHYVRAKGGGDPSEVVVDEVAGMLIAALGANSISGIGLAFLLFRLLDIAKPFPVSWADRKQGGFFVMLDDVIAGAFAGLGVLVLRHLLG